METLPFRCHRTQRHSRNRRIRAMAVCVHCFAILNAAAVVILLRTQVVEATGTGSAPAFVVTQPPPFKGRNRWSENSCGNDHHRHRSNEGSRRRSEQPSSRLWFDPAPRRTAHHRSGGSANSTDSGMSMSSSSTTEISATAAAVAALDPWDDGGGPLAPPSTEAFRSSTASPPLPPFDDDGKRRRRKIYCDMDGCLVNFERGVRNLLKRGSADFERDRTARARMWEDIAGSPRWFETLEWQMDGRRLWGAIRHLEPDILTGVPLTVKSARIEKLNWCKRELGLTEEPHHVDMAAVTEHAGLHESVNGNHPREDKTCNVITCWSSNKHLECHQRGSILIDDRMDLGRAWEDAGGIFVHHVNSETTIRKLRDLGVISSDPLEEEGEGWYWGEGSWTLWTDDDIGDDVDDRSSGSWKPRKVRGGIGGGGTDETATNDDGGDPVRSFVPTTTTTIRLGIIEMVDHNRDHDGWYWGEGSWNLWTGESDTAGCDGGDREDLTA